MGRGGKNCNTEGILEEYMSLGPQYVIVTKCLKEGVPIIFDVDNEPRLEILEDALGHQILWQVVSLQPIL